MRSIAVIIPYFGKWPSWADVFFHSCAMNDTVDFFFFTDCPMPMFADGVKNLHFNRVSFGRYCEMVSQKLDLNFFPDNTYKLCDIRPFYGIIHGDILDDFDFWGFGDLDLVWGDIRSFYTDDILEEFDILSTHADRISGHLALFRNLPDYNTAALKIPNWRSLLEDKKHYAMDEQHFTLLFYPEAKWLWKIHKYIYLRLKYEDEWYLYSRFLKRVNALIGIKKRRLFFVEQNTTPWFTDEMVKDETIRQQWRWRYNNEKVYDFKRDKELIYLHFLCLKKYWKENFMHINELKKSVMISLDGLYETN